MSDLVIHPFTMTDRVKPWHRHPDLTPTRLKFIIRLFNEVWEKAVRSYRPDLGDGRWGFGVKVYERWMSAFIVASIEAEWLGVMMKGLQFVAKVGELPFRFLRGDAENSRRRSVPAQESLQLKLAFPNSAGVDPKTAFRFVVDAAVKRYPRGVDSKVVKAAPKDLGTPSIYLVEYEIESGEIIDSWPLNRETLRAKDPAPMTPAPDHVLRGAFDVAPAQVKRKAKKKAASGEDDG
jgi:hypothetical protein